MALVVPVTSNGDASNEGAGRSRRSTVLSMKANVSDASHRPSPVNLVDEHFRRELKAQFQIYRRSLLSLLQAHLPKAILSLSEPGILEELRAHAPHLEYLEGCIVRVCISGVTKAVAQMLASGRGATRMSQSMEKLYLPLIEIVLSYRGDVIRFDGNVLIIFFKSVDDFSNFKHACGSVSCSHSAQELACLRAVACCIELQKRLSGVKICNDRINLSIGISVGNMSLVVLTFNPNSASHSFEFVAAGPPLYDAEVAEQIASPGEMVLCPKAWDCVQSMVIEGEPVAEKPAFHRLASLDVKQHTYPMVKHAARRSAPRQGDEDTSAVMARLATEPKFVSHVVVRHVAAGTLSNVVSHRDMCMVTINVSIVNPATPQGADKLARILHELKGAANAEEGFLMSCYTIGEGICFRLGFGLSPFMHTDDCIRACRCCNQMCILIESFGLAFRAGVSSGRVFCGTIGHKELRVSYVVMGDPVCSADLLCAKAEPQTIVLDPATAANCEGVFHLSEIFSGAAENDGGEHAGGMNRLGLEKSFVLRPFAQQGPGDFSKPNEPSSHLMERVMSPPTTPPAPRVAPWLSGMLPGEYDAHSDVEVTTQSSSYGYFCSERPPPAPGHLLLGKGQPHSDGQQLRQTATAEKPWKSTLNVPLPWPARSVLCGGASPLPKLQTWHSRQEAEAAVDNTLARGGGILVLAGQSGCGKIELLEHLVWRAISTLKFQPACGAMEARPGQRWAAYTSVLRGILALLEPSGHIGSQQEFHARLEAAAATPEETRALARAGLIATKGELRRSVTALEFAAKSITKMPSMSLCRSSSNLSSLQLAEVEEDHKAHENDDEDGDDKAASIIAGIAARLVKSLLEHGDVVLALRISQGTSHFAAETGPFWELTKTLGDLACQEQRHKLLVLVSCQKLHLDSCIHGAYRVIQIGPLGANEIHNYLHLCLGIEGIESSTKANAVPAELARWLGRIVSTPRDIEESLTQLHRERAITVRDGQCSVLMNLDSLILANWRGTRMVGRVLAELELMEPDMLYVLQIAAILDYPFSALDLAAANRVHLGANLPRFVAAYFFARRLAACAQLERAGLLQRCEGEEEEPFSPSSFTSLMSGPVDVHDGLPLDIPRWTVTSALMREVASSTITGRRRMLVKRTILLSRIMHRARAARSIALREYEEEVGMMGHSLSISSVSSSSSSKPKNRRTSLQLIQSKLLGVRRNLTNPDDLMVEADTPLVENTAPPASPSRSELYSLSADRDGTHPNVNSTSLFSSCIVTPKHVVSLDEDAKSQHTIDDANGSTGETFFDHRTSRFSVRRSIGPLFSKRVSLQSMNQLIGLQERSISPRVRSFFKFLWRFIQFLLCVALGFALFGPDLSILTDMTKDLALRLFIIVLCFLFVFSLLFVLMDSTYPCSSIHLLDVIVMTMGAIRIAEYSSAAAEGMEGTLSELEVQRKNPDKIIPMLLAWVNFGAVCGRLHHLLSKSFLAYFSKLVNQLKKALKKRKAVGHTQTEESDGEMESSRSRASKGDRKTQRRDDRGFLESFGRNLARAIFAIIAAFTVLTILTLSIVDVFSAPFEDMSMLSWVELIGRSNWDAVTTGIPDVVREDLRSMEAFYDRFEYGPYKLCIRNASAQGQNQEISACSSSLFQWDFESKYFSEPERTTFRLYVHDASKDVQAQFDFSRAAKLEAAMRMGVISLAVIAMLITLISVEHVLSITVVGPLTRLMKLVRQVTHQLQRDFPMFEFHEVGEENEYGEKADEITVFELNVQKVIGMVTLANKKGILADDSTNEWISGTAKAESGSPVGQGVNLAGQESPEKGTAGRRQTSGPDIESLEAIGLSYELINSWDFDVLLLEESLVTAAAEWLLLNTIDPALVAAPACVHRFVDAVSKAYEVVPYHSWRHAVDVLHGVVREINLAKVADYCPWLDIYALIVAATGHDAGHPGLNNPFLVATHHQLALRYNDLSPLENMHCSKTFTIMLDPAANVFKHLSNVQFKQARSVCIETILHTDNSKHFEMVKDLQTFYTLTVTDEEPSDDPFPCSWEIEVLQQAQSRTTFLNAFLHAADISNPCKPWSICSSWSDLVLAEFFAQGDREKQLGIPVQMLNDRDTVKKPSSQVAFIRFFVVPFNTAFVNIFSPMCEFSSNLSTNLRSWHEMNMVENENIEASHKQQVEDTMMALDTVYKKSKKRAGQTPGVRPASKERTGTRDSARRGSEDVVPPEGAVSTPSGGGRRRSFQRLFSPSFAKNEGSPSDGGAQQSDEEDTHEHHPLAVPKP